MAIEVFEGRLGGGKSYSAVERIAAVLARGGTVCTNIDIVWPEMVAFCASRFGVKLKAGQLRHLSEGQIPNFHLHTPGGTMDCPTLVVIDEAQLYWNARDFSKTDKDQRELLKFLTQSRKAGTDVIFITQNVKNVDAQFVRLVQFVWRFRDMSKYRVPGLGIRWPFDQILQVCFDYDGKTQQSRRLARKDKAIFKLYDTTELLQSFDRAGTVGRVTLERAKPKRKLKMKWIVLALVASGFAIYKLVSGGLPFVPSDPAPVAASAPAPDVVFRDSQPVPSFADSPPAPSAAGSGLEPGEPVWAGRYFVVLEGLRGAGVSRVDGLPYLVTSGGTYRLGKNCRYGRVEKVQGRKARVRMRDGRTMVVETFDDSRERWAEFRRRQSDPEPLAEEPSPALSPAVF